MGLTIFWANFGIFISQVQNAHSNNLKPTKPQNHQDRWAFLKKPECNHQNN